jgi:hypothetical protein
MTVDEGGRGPTARAVRRPHGHRLSAWSAARSATPATAWRGYRIDDPNENEPPALAFYCPTCAYREFG